MKRPINATVFFLKSRYRALPLIKGVSGVFIEKMKMICDMRNLIQLSEKSGICFQPLTTCPSGPNSQGRRLSVAQASRMLV